jgi:hypothetical protein
MGKEVPLEYNLDVGAYLVDGSVVAQVTEAGVVVHVEIGEVADGWRASEWMVIWCGFRRSNRLEMGVVCTGWKLCGGGRV